MDPLLREMYEMSKNTPFDKIDEGLLNTFDEVRRVVNNKKSSMMVKDYYYVFFIRMNNNKTYDVDFISEKGKIFNTTFTPHQFEVIKDHLYRIIESDVKSKDLRSHIKSNNELYLYITDNAFYLPEEDNDFPNKIVCDDILIYNPKDIKDKLIIRVKDIKKLSKYFILNNSLKSIPVLL